MFPSREKNDIKEATKDEALDQFLNDTRKYLQLIDDPSSMKSDLTYDGLEIEV